MWLNKSSFECNVNFELIGTLLGLAIYNSVLLDLNFPKIVYKKLRDLPGILEDLKEFEPDLFNTLNNISKMEEGFESLYMTMSISYDNFGLEEVFELIPGGKDIPLTRENRDQFVELYLDWYFNKSIEKQFKPFYKGFYKCISKQSITVSHKSLTPVIRRRRAHRPCLRQGRLGLLRVGEIDSLRRLRRQHSSGEVVLGNCS
jgi:hypothetical protein